MPTTVEYGARFISVSSRLGRLDTASNGLENTRISLDRDSTNLSIQLELSRAGTRLPSPRCQLQSSGK